MPVLPPLTTPFDATFALLAPACALFGAWAWHGRQVARRALAVADLRLREAEATDPLTGLANRQAFEAALHAATAQPRQPLAVLLVDLDGFRPVNDTLGHACGDDLLRQAACRLSSLLGPDDQLARIGADEFVLRMQGDVTRAVTLAERLVAHLGHPFTLAGRPFTLSASVGIALHPDDGGAGQLIGHADAAMGAAKRAGGAQYALYRPHMDAHLQEQLALQEMLREALAAGALELHYQPKVVAATGAIAGAEALLRWKHAERGWISPAVFVPVAERFGLIGALGDWVIEEACRQIGAWQAAGRDMQVAINVSAHQLRGDGLAARIERACRRHGVEPSRLLCEVTETAAMEDLGASREVFDALARIGVYLSIDDFGTGWSSLAYLRQLPARQLKIDRSFVADLDGSADARAVVHAVVDLAHALGLSVVAEGVETEAQRDVLAALGCDELQGWCFARPMAPAAFETWCDERQAALV